MRFLVDENLPPQLAVWLCELGHDALHVERIAVKGEADAALLLLSIAEQRIIVTKDSDFDGVAPPARVMRLCVGNTPTSVLLAWLTPRLQPALEQLGSGAGVVLVR